MARKAIKLDRVLIANRGEIAIRIAEAVAAFGRQSVAVYAIDDARSLHRYRADQAVALAGAGPGAYLDIPAMIAAAKQSGCDAVHPGYGFLAENAAFARACEQAGLLFVGPSPAALELFADKSRARALATANGVPVLEGSDGAATASAALAFFRRLPAGSAMVIKAIAGGGGRGLRIVRDAGEVDEAYRVCAQEAQQAFGDRRVLVERFMPRARHIEVQVIADRHGTLAHAGERDCSLQRRNQKIVEVTPSPNLCGVVRKKLTQAALTLAEASGLQGLATIEFLVEARAFGPAGEDASYAFLEANPRIQVEHTVTEEALDIDLVQAQLAIAAGARLADLGFDQKRLETPRRAAVQLRINAERIGGDGVAHPVTGRIDAFEPGSGRGVRVDTYAYAGYDLNPRYDSLIAKLVVSSPIGDFSGLLGKARRALAQTRIDGVETNAQFLAALLAEDGLEQNMHTRFVDENAGQILERRPQPASIGPDRSLGLAAVDETDRAEDLTGTFIRAPLPGLVASIDVRPGDAVAAGGAVASIEAMKMVTLVTADTAGVIKEILVAPGDQVRDGQAVARIEPSEVDEAAAAVADATVDHDAPRPDLAALLARRRLQSDEARPEAVAKRRALGRRTARELVASLCDADTFIEYGGLAIAAQSRRRSRDDLIRSTPADGIITGFGDINGATAAMNSRCAVMAYDYTVLAGTQGHRTHHKMDRVLEIAERSRTPVVLFSEGGGGRPGDTDILSVTGLDVASFQMLARMSGLAPLVGVNSGRCFAGNAAMLGCCDVIISTERSSIGMGGPALIEGGGLGVVAPDDVGPMSIMTRNGVVDILVSSDDEAVAAAKSYLSFFQGDRAEWSCADQRALRTLLPSDRVRTYDIRRVVSALADADSALELRKDYGRGILTFLARIEGRPVGLIANNPLHLGGAIDAPAADKASRFMQLCDAHALPIVVLCDTPGFMVGPESEKNAAVRRFARMFVTAAGLSTSVYAIVLRKAYGLGAMAMMAGRSHVPNFVVSWPSGEFGGMGLEGAIRLGLRKELDAIKDPVERNAFFRKQVDAAYAWGRAENAASLAEIDDVIDPAETRKWLAAGLRLHAPQPMAGKRRTHIDTW